MSDTVTNEITLDQLLRVTPKSRHSTINQGFIDDINGMIDDDTAREAFRDNVLGYSDVLRSGSFSIKQYVGAIKYVTFKMQDMSNIEAFTRTFPVRYQEMINKGYATKDINSAITTFSKTKLVIRISEQAQMPTHLINADVYQKSINVLAEMMITARSEKCRVDAAAKLVDALKPPETKKIELDLSVKNSDGIDELRQATLELVRSQKLSIESGAQDAKDIAHQKLAIQGEIEEAVYD